jgi:glyoxylase-like metal-dependent hydrolase (beta-lactamase superfamily II)
VASLALEEPGLLVLVDPQLPESGATDAALAELLERAAAGRSEVHVIVTNAWHARSASSIRGRFPDAAIHVPRDIAGEMPCAPTHRYGDGAELPGGIRAHAVAGLHPGEHVLHLPRLRALVPGDALLGAVPGAPEELRLAPRSWSADPERYPEMSASLGRLGDLDVEMVLVSHGAPVLAHGREALARALAAARELDAAEVLR